MKINRSLFYDLTDPCTRSGEFQTVVNGSQPASLLKLDNTRYKTPEDTFQTFDCVIKIKTEFVNKVSDHYDGTEDIALVMFDISHGNKM